MYRFSICFLSVCLLHATLAARSPAQEDQSDTRESQGTTAAAQSDSGGQAEDANRQAGAARPAARPTPADPTGSWKWEFTPPYGDPLEFMLKLKWDGKKVTGKYTSFGNTVDVEEAKLDKDALAFVVRPEFNGNAFDVEFEGKVAKDEIRGTIGLDFGYEPQEFEWIAKRFVDVDDVVGTWQLEIALPGGNVAEPTLTVTQKDRALQAKYASEFLGELEAQNVQIKENQLLFEISNEDADFAFTSKYAGTPRGNAIEGKAEFDFGGNAGEMTFTGKRLPPKEEKKTESARDAGAERTSERTDAGRAQSTDQGSGEENAESADKEETDSSDDGDE